MELAAAVLPVPLFGGTAEQFWRSYEPDLTKMLQIDKATAERWRSPIPGDSARLSQLAVEMVAALINALPRQCFVIMPFSEDQQTLYYFVIERATVGVGDHPIRSDRTAIPGDIGQQIQEGIRRCDYVIAVLDGLHPNVLYELGLAHAYGKPSILLNRAGNLGRDSVTPFDLSMQQRLEYSTLEPTLVERLKNAITRLRPARQ